MAGNSWSSAAGGTNLAGNCGQDTHLWLPAGGDPVTAVGADGGNGHSNDADPTHSDDPACRDWQAGGGGSGPGRVRNGTSNFQNPWLAARETSRTLVWQQYHDPPRPWPSLIGRGQQASQLNHAQPCCRHPLGLSTRLHYVPGNQAAIARTWANLPIYSSASRNTVNVTEHLNSGTNLCGWAPNPLYHGVGGGGGGVSRPCDPTHPVAP